MKIIINVNILDLQFIISFELFFLNYQPKFFNRSEKNLTSRMTGYQRNTDLRQTNAYFSFCQLKL